MMRTLLISLLALLTWAPTALADTAQAGTSITFRQGKLIEAVFFRIKPGQEQALADRYFKKVAPLVKRYGAKRLGFFEVTHIEHGPDDAAGWGFFEWPDEATKARFDRDPAYQKLRKVRDGMLDSLKMVYLQTPETVTVQLKPSHMYEFFGVHVNRHNASHLQAYFKVAGPWLTARGVKFPVQLEVVGTAEGYPFLPQRVGFIEWPNAEVKRAWFKSNAFRQVGWHRAMALDRLYVVESRLPPPGS